MSTRMPHRPAVTMRTHHVFAIAHDLADRHGSIEVTPLHVLLAMLREGRSPAIVVLYNLGVGLDELERELEAELPAAVEAVPEHELSWTAAEERMLDRAAAEARDIGHRYQGCEHLLLTFLRDDASAPAAALARHGVRFANARAEVVRVLGTPPETGTSTVNAPGV
jgi:ATP-dependent Clp protease ATP-binding subunit ClpA